jgi:catechol 2,3-dioxygenase-like lactoylglutathione lyase family enzyme
MAGVVWRDMFTMRSALFLAAAAAFAPGGFSQVLAPNSMGVSMGHLHLNSSDPEAQKKFWVDVIGARAAKLGPVEVYAMPGVLVMITKKPKPPEPTEGSVVNHIGVKVKDYDGVLAKVKAAGMTATTVSETQSMVAGPDGLKVELIKDPQAEAPAMNHHIHFFTQDVAATQKWYVDTFGAVKGKRGRFEAADLPGVNLSFSPADAKTANSKGRALDHIGFEVRDLEAFTKKLESSGVKLDMQYRKVPNLGIAIAFFTDPWGTYIELTEGLAQVK